MSELTTCNYCHFNRIKKHAEEQGKTVHQLRPGYMGGTDIFVVPKGEPLPSRSEMIMPCDKYPNGNKAYNKYHVSWMMSIPTHCCC